MNDSCDSWEKNAHESHELARIWGRFGNPMLDFSRRSTQTEIIDDMTLDRAVMDRVLGDLNRINRFLGGYGTTIDAVRRMLPDGKRDVRMLDVGAGGGDTARRLVEWGRATGRAVRVVSVDLSFAAVAFARGRLAG